MRRRAKMIPFFTDGLGHAMLLAEQYDLDLQHARALFGPRCFAAAEWATFYPSVMAGSDIIPPPPLPWDAATIQGPCPFVAGRQVCQTHALFLAPSHWKSEPLTIRQWKKLVPSWFISADFCEDTIQIRQATCQPGWYLMPIGDALARGPRSYAQALASLPASYRAGTIIEEATYLMLLRTVRVLPRLSGPEWSSCADTIRLPPSYGTGPAGERAVGIGRVPSGNSERLRITTHPLETIFRRLSIVKKLDYLT